MPNGNTSDKQYTHPTMKKKDGSGTFREKLRNLFNYKVVGVDGVGTEYAPGDDPYTMFFKDREKYLYKTGDREGYSNMVYDKEKYRKIYEDYQRRLKGSGSLASSHKNGGTLVYERGDVIDFAKPILNFGISKPGSPNRLEVTPPPKYNFGSASSGQPSSGRSDLTRRGFADYANLALGAYGLTSSLSGNKPQLERPRQYRSIIKPATGNESLLQRNMNRIATNANSARRGLRQRAGSNTSAYVQGSLAINDQRNKAEADALAYNAELFRQEQDRVYSQLNNDRQVNYENNRAYDEAMYRQRLGEWLGRQERGRQMLQSAINYEQQRSADLANKGIAERQANTRIDMMSEGMLYDQAVRLVVAGRYPNVEAAMEALRKGNQGRFDQYKTYNYQRKYGGLIRK